MAHIVLPEEQAAQVPNEDSHTTQQPVGPNEQRALEIHRRRQASAFPRRGVPGEQVQAFLLMLEEVRQCEGDIDKERVFLLLQGVRAGRAE